MENKIIFHNYYEELNKNNAMFVNSNVTIGDDLLKPMMELEKYASTKGVTVGTHAAINVNEADAFVFIDMPRQKDRTFQAALGSGKPMYLIMAESKIVRPANYDVNNKLLFRKMFTYDDSLVDGEKYLKINYSFVFPKDINRNLDVKNKLCVIIAGNKKLNHPQELYSEREKAIRWFEINHPEKFDLYGVGWDEFTFGGPKPIAYLNMIRPLRRLLAPYYPSYRGPVDRKKSVLEKYKFSICYENTKGIPGYITEKIFDCFFSGCVPIYLGANNIKDHIPEECFIDRGKFSSYEQLYDFLVSMTNDDYLRYLDAIENYLKSSRSHEFTCDYYSRTIVDTILAKFETE